jgi:hypothetical protein
MIGEHNHEEVGGNRCNCDTCLDVNMKQSLSVGKKLMDVTELHVIWGPQGHSVPHSREQEEEKRRNISWSSRQYEGKSWCR